jgi:ABC-type transporter Mla MlaB component
VFAGAGFDPAPAEGKEGRSVLRIASAAATDSLVTLKAEGALVGDWVLLLEGECLRHLAASRQVQLDLADVSVVDRDGLAMLEGLVTEGVGVVRASTLVYALLWRPPGHHESG